MQHVARLILIPLLAAAMTGGVWATENARETTLPTAEYKRSDTNFYPKADVVQAHPSAVILPEGSFTRKGDSYFFTPHKKAPKEMYVETLNDWVEPITPPDMPASLGVPPDAMQIREPRGDVQAALPSAPANFSPVTDGMTLPNGAVVKTGADGTAAVLFGGVDSARLMPNSAAAVQQTVTAQARSAEVDLTAGGVFSKVGAQVGVKGEYEVHTPFGNAVAQGGDFVTMISGSRTDVWVAQGAVNLANPSETKSAAIATSDGTGPLKILRDPGIADPHQAMLADAETLTAILNFIPMANQKIKALRDKATGGATLTTNEQAYLKRIKQVPCLIKLALVEPPAPAASTPPPAAASAPASEMPAPSVPGLIVPTQINLRADGMVEVNGAPMDLDNLKSRLADIAKANPAHALLITGRENVTGDQLKKVIAICHAAKLKVTVAKPAVVHPTPVAPAAANPPATNPPAPAAASAPAATPALPPPASTAPIRAVVRIDGKINFQGVTFTPAEFKSRLEAIIKMTPDQAIVIKAGKTVPYEKFEAVMDICHSAQVKNLTVATPAPTPAPTPKPVAPAAAEPAANLPAPGLLMHSPADSMSSNAAPMSPSGLPAPTPSTPNTNTPAGNPPTTNAPASAAP